MTTPKKAKHKKADMPRFLPCFLCLICLDVRTLLPTNGFSLKVELLAGEQKATEQLFMNSSGEDSLKWLVDMNPLNDVHQSIPPIFVAYTSVRRLPLGVRPSLAFGRLQRARSAPSFALASWWRTGWKASWRTTCGAPYRPRRASDVFWRLLIIFGFCAAKEGGGVGRTTTFLVFLRPKRGVCVCVCVKVGGERGECVSSVHLEIVSSVHLEIGSFVHLMFFNSFRSYMVPEGFDASSL